MTWDVVARKDFRDAVRSWWLLGLTAFFVVLYVGITALATGFVGAVARQVSSQGTSNAVVLLIRRAVSVLVPIVAVLMSYAALTGERQTGTLKLLLSLPHSRRDVVAGKVVGRGGVIAVPVLVGFVVSMLVFPLTSVSLRAGTYVQFALLSALFGLVWVGIAVGISAGARSNRGAMFGTVGIYVLFTLLWNQLVNSVMNAARNRLDLGTEAYVDGTLLLKHLNPSQAFNSLSARIIATDAVSARVSTVGGVFGSPTFQGQLKRQVFAQTLGDSLPFYLTDPAVVVMLLLWLVVPPALGYLVFEEEDL